MPTPTSTSDLQIAANRANAAHSTGPRTAAGKAASSQNAVSHGLNSALLTVFRWESKAAFDRLRDAYLLRFRPIDEVESGRVDQMVDSVWRRTRVLSIETTLIDLEICNVNETIEDEFPPHTIDGLLRMTLAFRDRHGDNTSMAIQRYISATERSFSRALRELKLLQGERFNKSQEAIGMNGFDETDAIPEPEPLDATPEPEAIREMTEQTHFPAPAPQNPPQTATPLPTNEQNDGPSTHERPPIAA